MWHISDGRLKEGAVTVYPTFKAPSSSFAALDTDLQRLKTLYTQLLRAKAGSMRDQFSSELDCGRGATVWLTQYIFLATHDVDVVVESRLRVISSLLHTHGEGASSIRFAGARRVTWPGCP